MTEFEIKLEIPPASLAGVLAKMQALQPAKVDLTARYFDTAQADLGRHGVVVRVRKEGRGWVQTAKGPARSPAERLEHNVPIEAPAKGEAPTVDLARHAGTAVGKAIRRALRLKKGDDFPPLLPLYQTEIGRQVAVVRSGAALVELALDQGRIVAGSSESPVSELEFELKAGEAADVVTLAREWRSEHALWLSTLSKSMKGRHLAQVASGGPVATAAGVDYQAGATGQEILQAAMSSCLDQVLGNASEVAAGSEDDDHIHQLRVGLRRLRTCLGELEPISSGIDPAWADALTETFRILGRHRDGTHLARSLQPQIEAAGGPVLPAPVPDDGAELPSAAVQRPAFQDALLGLLDVLHRGAPNGPAAAERSQSMGARAAKKHLSRRLAKLHRQVTRDGARFSELEESQQHRVRKRLKRLRYLSEFTAPLFGPKQTEAFIARLKPAQDVLGLYNDEVTTLHAYLARAAQEPQAWFGAGWLSARREQHAKACQRALLKVEKAPPFWN